MKKFYQNHHKLINFLIIELSFLFVFAAWYIKYTQHLAILIVGGIILILNFIYTIKTELCEKIFDKLLQYRYFIALLIFVICVSLKISGSSIGMYNYYFPQAQMTENSNILLGTSRGIRSDEWLVQTPYYFSQYTNDFQRISNQMSIDGQDMIIGYNSPVKDISLLAKPLVWGYVLLGNEYGLSWYWCMKIILMILFSFEFIMILTRKNKKLSVLGALLISFAPAIQWWFVPHLSDVFLWGMGLLVTGYHFFTATKKWFKNLLTLIIPFLAIGFVLALYPPLQVPVGLIAVALLIAFLIRDKEKITFAKKDIIRIIGMLIVVIGIVGYEVLCSKNAITLLSNTDYPGTRMLLGNDSTIDDIFTNLVTLFLPYKSITYSNNCEISDFLHFGPLCLLIFFMSYKKLKEAQDKDLIIGKFLTGILIIELVYMLIGFPPLLSKITLFSYINRMFSVYGFTATVYTIYIVHILYKNKNLLSKKEKRICLITCFIFYLFLITKESLTYLPLWIYLVEIGLFTFLLSLILNRQKYLPYALTISLIMFSGFFINPITIGTKSITEHQIVKETKKLQEEDDGYFLTTDNIITGSLLLANGNKVLNAVNYYPDFEKWNKIDPTGEHKTFYNRYLHENIEIVDDATSYILSNADLLSIKLNILDIEKLPVKYIVTSKDLTQLATYSKTSLKFLKKVDDLNIYKFTD